MIDFLLLIKNFSYLGIFLASLISTSTIFLPAPIYLIIFASPSFGLNPIAVSIVSGLGAALGELSGYFIGLGGREIIQEKRKKSRIVRKFTKYFGKFGFLVIVITAAIPFPFDVIGILAGVSRYDVKKFLIATFIGKTIKSLLIVYAGYASIPYLQVLMGL